MSAYNTTLLDEDDNEIYPKTLAENVYDGNVRMDQKVDGIRTDLGNPSSASAVTGADAFSKISKLNSDLSNLLDASTKPNASNANDCTDAGSYSFNTSTQNTPASGYYVALVIKRGANDCCMIACDVNNNKLYVRTLNSGTWMSWKTIVS